MDKIELHLDKLPIFLEVAQAGSIRSAAVILRVSQPAVSRSIKILEENIGKDLFIRDGSGVTLTTAGQNLFEIAKEVRSKTQKYLHDLSNPKKFKQHIRLGAYESIAVYLLPNFIKFARQAQGNLDLSIHTAPSSVLVERLKGEDLDLIVSVNPSAHKNIISTKLFDDIYGVFLARSLEVDAKTPLIAKFDALDLRKTSVGSHVEESVHSNRSRFECASIESVKALSLAGVGLGVLPLNVAAPEIVSGKFREHHDGRNKLWRFGPHGVFVSHHAKRKDDLGLQWLLSELKKFAVVSV